MLSEKIFKCKISLIWIVEIQLESNLGHTLESAYGQQDDQGKFADLVPVILSSLFL